jgi:lipid A 3-O-deacylase
VAGILYLPHPVWAQEATAPALPQPPLPGETPTAPTMEDALSKEVRGSKKNTIITAVYENDLIGSGKDAYYTSGVRFSYFDLHADFPDIAHKIDDLIPTFSINETSSIVYSVGQNIYTPENITTPNPVNRVDRPYAGYLYGSMGMVSLTDNHADEIELTIGIVGPASLAEQTQKAIHTHLTDSPTPKGWSHQLKNEPALTLGWQRSWPSFYSLDAGLLAASFSPYAGITVGNVYDFVNGGVSFRISPRSEFWQDAPVRVRPAMPGTGFFEIPERKWSWYLFGGLEGRAIARNIFLDGNTFTDSPSVEKKHFVGDATAGLALTYDQIRVSYTAVYRTKEFEGQDGDTIFGAMSVGYRF